MVSVVVCRRSGLGRRDRSGGRGADPAAHQRRRRYGRKQENHRQRERFEECSHLHASISPAIRDHSSTRRSRSALPMTDTELKLIAAAAIIGDSSTPNSGYSTPAATGIPAAL